MISRELQIVFSPVHALFGTVQSELRQKFDKKTMTIAKATDTDRIKYVFERESIIVQTLFSSLTY